MASAVRYIRAIGIHNRFDLELEFEPGVNILYGKNGTGKTTLLHILANILNGDFERFAFLPFETIEVYLDEGQKIKLREYKHSEGNKVEVYIGKTEVANFLVSETRQRLLYSRSRLNRPDASTTYLRTFQQLKPILSTDYFPAFRTLIEASSNEDPFYDPYPPFPTKARYDRQQTLSSTLFARRFFGDFVPWLNYPSPEEVGHRLSSEMQQALNVVADIDRQLLSKAFLDIFATLSKESNSDTDQSERILEKIKSLFSRLENSSIINDPSSGEEVYSKLRELVLSFRVRPETEEVYVPNIGSLQTIFRGEG